MEKTREKMLAICYFFILSFMIRKYEYNPRYEITDGIAFASYDYGKIYILNSENDVESLDLNPMDIVVIDYRLSDDPNFQILDSYKVDDKQIRNVILCCLLEYEKMYPTKWDRSIQSLRNEWTIHNISYITKYKRNHSVAVDLNNNDEEKYDSKLLKKILYD